MRRGSEDALRALRDWLLRGLGPGADWLGARPATAPLKASTRSSRPSPASTRNAHRRAGPYYLSLLAEAYSLVAVPIGQSAILEAAIAMAIERSELWWLPALYLQKSTLVSSPHPRRASSVAHSTSPGPRTAEVWSEQILSQRFRERFRNAPTHTLSRLEDSYENRRDS